MDEIINKVANSGIVTIDLEEFYVEGERVLFDIKPHLFMEQILKEKDFREFIKSNDWSQSSIFCSPSCCTGISSCQLSGNTT